MAPATSPLPRLMAADAEGIAAAVALLAAGGIAAVPTETVYGLAADAADGAAVAAVYAAKGRPAFNPLIVHVADRAMAARYAHFPPVAERLAAHCWPGGLTMVLPMAVGAPVAALVTAGLSTIALRVPSHPAMQAVIRGLGRGIAAPSANPSSQLSPTRAAHVVAGLAGCVPLVLDGGASATGVESTIVGVHEDGVHAGLVTLLRHGAWPREALEEALGHAVAMATDGAAISAPGMLLRHYAPRLPVRLGALTAAAEEYHLGYGPVAGDASLSADGNPVEAAARLFDLLHRADASGRHGIAVAPVPEQGLGAAINDRLRRAARGRDPVSEKLTKQ